MEQPAAPRQAIRIMTGAPAPPGIDAVVRLEDAVIEDNALVLREPLRRLAIYSAPWRRGAAR